MAVVFVFLWLMVICVSLTAELIHKMGLDEDIEQSVDQPSKEAGEKAPPAVIAAIKATVTEYRKEE